MKRPRWVIKTKAVDLTFVANESYDDIGTVIVGCANI